MRNWWPVLTSVVLVTLLLTVYMFDGFSINTNTLDNRNDLSLNSYSHGSQSGSQKDGHSRHGNEMWLSGRRIRLPWDLYPYKPYNESTRLIAKAETSNDQKELLNLYDMYMVYIPYDCRTRGRFGPFTIRGSGGYDVCLVGPYKPRDHCLIYSFGVSHIWTFEDMMAKEFGCLSRTFDPNMEQKEYEHVHNVMFYPYGIGKEKKGKIRTLNTLLEQFNEEHRIIDVLKIDTEGAEFAAFSAISNGNILSRVKQVAMEIHLRQEPSITSLHQAFSIFRLLEEYGFRKWTFRETPYGESPHKSKTVKRWRFTAHDISFINMNYLDPSYKPLS